MPLTILDLPMEILNLIVESVPIESSWAGRRKRRDMCFLLRLTCKEINAKLLRYYGVNLYKRIKVSLIPDNLTVLNRLSQGPLAHHIESLTFDVEAIVSTKPWAGVSVLRFLEEDADFLFETSPKRVLKVRDPRTAAVLFGLCPVLLGPTLSRLSGLKEFHILGPYNCGEMNRTAWNHLSSMWSGVIRSLFTLALSQAPRLEVLAADSRNPLYACASVLENIAMCWRQRETLTTLHLCLNFDNCIGTAVTIEQHVYILKKILDTSPNLTNLQINFGDYKSDSSRTFFHLLSQSTSIRQNRNKLRRISLSFMKLSFNDLQTFLLSHRFTIMALKLNFVTFDTEFDRFGAFLGTKLPHLKEICLEWLNFGTKGLNFWQLHVQRPLSDDFEDPMSLDGEDWVYITEDDTGHDHEFVLDEAKGDDIEYWMRAVDEYPYWVDMHLWWNEF